MACYVQKKNPIISYDSKFFKSIVKKRIKIKLENSASVFETRIGSGANIVIGTSLMSVVEPGPARKRGEISPGGTFRGRQKYVSSSTGKYGIGIKIRKIYNYFKNFVIF